jgi:hypothetical protein
VNLTQHLALATEALSEMLPPLRILQFSLAFIVFVLPARASSAGSEQAASPFATQEQVLVAQKLMDEGAAAYAQGDLEVARDRFMKAWGIVKHRAIAGNLAEVEMRLQEYESAAQHLKFVVGSLGVEALAERAQAETQLAECTRQLAVLRVNVGVADATVRVNGRVIGTTPIGEPALVKPGEAQLEVTRTGYQPNRTTVALQKGETKVVTVILKPIPLVSNPDATRSSSRAESVAVSNPAKTYVLLSGAVLTAAGIGVGTAYWLTSRSTKSDYDQWLGDANQGVDKNIIAANQACKPPAKHPSACERLPELDSEYNTQRRWMNTGFVAAAIAALATTTTLLLWPSKQASPKKALSVSPWSLGNGNGVQLIGAF